MLPAVGTNEPIRNLSTSLELQPTRPSPAQAASLTQRTANQEDTCHSPGCQASETRSSQLPCRRRGYLPACVRFLHLQKRAARSVLSIADTCRFAAHYQF